MSISVKFVFGWAFVMIAFSIIPYVTSIVSEPSPLLMVVMLGGIGLIAAFIGKQFDDK